MAVLPPDPVFCLKGDMGPIHSLCFPTQEYVNSSSLLLASTENGFVHFWDLETNRRWHKQKMGESIQVVHSIEGDIVTQEKSGCIKLWTLESRNKYVETKSYECYGGFCKSVLVNANIIVPQKNNLEIVELSTMEKLKTFEADEEYGTVTSIKKIEFNKNDYVLGGYESGTLIMWDYKTGNKITEMKLKEFITSISFDPIRKWGIVSNSSNTLQVFQIEQIDADINISLKCEIPLTNDGFNVVNLRDDAKVFVTGGWDGRVRFHSWRTLRVLVVLTEHKKAVTDVKFSPFPVNLWKQNIMAAASADGVISLWSLYN